MKIAIPSTGKDMDSMVDMRFGRCPYFMIVELEGKKIKGHKALENTSIRASHGAGITAAQLVANSGVEAIISGNIGPKAFDVLSSTGIRIFTGAFDISVKQAVEKYTNGELQEASMPTGPGHRAGMGRGFR